MDIELIDSIGSDKRKAIGIGDRFLSHFTEQYKTIKEAEKDNGHVRGL
jgi:hypothetical protein